MNAKRFLYGAAGLLLFTAAYTLGAGRAQGQATSNRVVGVSNVTLDNGGNPREGVLVVTENGEPDFKTVAGGASGGRFRCVHRRGKGNGVKTVGGNRR